MPKGHYERVKTTKIALCDLVSCGNTYEVPRYNTGFCSQACVNQFKWHGLGNEERRLERARRASDAHRRQGNNVFDLALIKAHPVHYKYFRNMMFRILHGGLPSDFTNDDAGLRSFIDHTGPVPSDMNWPSVGRRDHSKGYILGNFRWQEFTENLSQDNRT